MRKLAWVLVIVAVAMVFALQNADPVPVHFLFWKIESARLALVLLVTFVSGVITGLLFLTPRLMRKSKSDKPHSNSESNRPTNQNPH